MKLLDPSPVSAASAGTPHHGLSWHRPVPYRVVVIEPMGVGGISHYAYCLCQALEAKGVPTTLITSRNYELADRPRAFRLYPFLREWFRPAATPFADRVVRPPRLSEVFGRRLDSVRSMLRIVAVVLKERASIVHVQWPVGPHDWLYLAVLRWLRRRIVYTAHDIVPHEHASAGVARLRRLLRFVDRVIVHCRQNDIAFRRIFCDLAPPTHVIPHGNYFFFDGIASMSRAEARAAVGVPLRSPVALFFGAIRPYKGLNQLITAFGHVRRQLPAAWLVVAGYPYEDFAPYERTIAATNLRDCTALHLGYHPMPEVAKFFRAADIIVLPYHRASQSGIAQLAFAFGLPVVATRVGGLPEIIEDHSTGLLVNAGDERELADAMLRLLTDPSLRRALSARAREEAATRYSWSHVAQLTQEVYDAAKEAIVT